MTTAETSLAGNRIVLIGGSTERARASLIALAGRTRQVAAHKLPPPEEAAGTALRAGAHSAEIPRVTLRIDPIGRKSRREGSRR